MFSATYLLEVGIWSMGFIRWLLTGLDHTTCKAFIHFLKFQLYLVTEISKGDKNMIIVIWETFLSWIDNLCLEFVGYQGQVTAWGLFILVQKNVDCLKVFLTLWHQGIVLDYLITTRCPKHYFFNLLVVY